MTTNTKQKPRKRSGHVDPTGTLRTITVPEAAGELNVHPATVHNRIRDGVFTRIGNEFGPGKRQRVYADEIALYAAGQMDALRQLVYERRTKGGRVR
jgi:hypothetical protein